MSLPLILAAALCPTLAAPGDGVLFHASYDRWLLADQAAGGRAPFRRSGAALGEGKLGRALQLDGSGFVEYPAGAN
ncbi:MAG: hypothetical protein HYU66_12540, partial [Armatimonadetes bacterium]|nr:hypothetical protein [Armatimonadota bacterium]